MKDFSKTIAEAQEFIDSINAFHKQGEAENDNDSPVRDSGSDPSSSFDNSLQSDLEKNNSDGRHRISSNLPSISFNRNGSRPAFYDVKFSPKTHYDNPFRADLLTFIEVYYYENKRLPDVHVLHEHFRNHPERPNFLKGWNSTLDSVADALQNRGIKPYNTVENYIDPKFAWAVSLIVNHLDKRTIPAKLKEAGLTTKEWQSLLRRKRHFDYFQTRLDEVFDNDVKNDAKLALARSIQNGDLQAIKYYNELKNIYRPETQSAVQMVSIVLTAVMEILAQHVSSEVINRVAAEIRNSPSVRKVIEAQSR